MKHKVKKKKKIVQSISSSLFLLSSLFIFMVFCLNASAQGASPADTGPAANVSITADTAPEMPFEQRLKMKISVDYKDADLLTVLRSLSWTYKLNIVTSPDIKGKVTISLEDVTVKEALEAIIAVNGLAYSIRKNIIYVSPGDAEAIELVSEVIFLKYMKAADAQNLMRKAVSAKGDIKIDEVANSLIVTDFPSNIQKVKNLLEKVDVAPRQVLIEAKIVDITSTDLEALGVTYNLEYAPQSGLFDRATHYNEELDYTMNLAEQSSDLTGGQFVLDTLTLKHLTLTATLDALARDGKVHVLASPSIAVLNGQEARIIIGERYPYKERTQTTTGTTETTKFVDIGTTLRVQPQINYDGYITMKVHPEVSSLAAALDAGPRVTTREADTTVRVREGETLVIGGLIKQDDSSSKDKVPYLGDIPLIGALFTRSEHENEQKELAVFITPTILYSRDEKEKELGYEDSRKHEVFVNLKRPAELNIVEKLYKQARDLDMGRSLTSRGKARKVRKNQALGLYEHIYYEYPDSMRAPQALLYAGKIYLEDYGDYKHAKESFARLISDYPDSGFASKAKELYTMAEEKEREEKGEVTRAAPFEARPLRAIGEIMPPRMLNLNIFGNGEK